MTTGSLKDGRVAAGRQRDDVGSRERTAGGTKKEFERKHWEVENWWATSVCKAQLK